jgi:hypothetical protein
VGEPRINETIASRAILIFWKEPRMWIFLWEVSCHVYVMDKKYVSLRIGENDAGATGIFYGELGLAILTGDAALREKSMSAMCNPSMLW